MRNEFEQKQTEGEESILNRATSTISRRSLLLGTAAAAALRFLENPRLSFAEHDGVVKNTEINEAPPYTWFHPMSENGKVWSYGVMFRDPALKGAKLSDQGNVGELFLNGPSDVGVDTITNSRYLADYKGNGARAAIWMNTTAKDILVLMNEDNDKAPTPVAATVVDDSGFAGLLLPNGDAQLGIRVVRNSGSTEAVRLTFGNIFQEDFAKPAHPSVIDSSKFVNVTKSQTPTVTPTPVPQRTQTRQTPEFIADLPVSTFDRAPLNSYFLARSKKGEGWSHGLSFAIPNRPAGIFYTDNGNAGEMFVLNRNNASSFDLFMRVNPIFIEDFKQGAENRPAMWIKIQPRAIIQLLHNGSNELLTFNADGRDHPVQVLADGAGFGGIVFPEYKANVKIRIVLPHPEVDTDTQIQFGPERPEDKGKPSTLDTNFWIPKP